MKLSKDIKEKSNGKNGRTVNGLYQREYREVKSAFSLLKVCAICDTVYIYVGGNFKSIMYKCEVIAMDLYGNRAQDDIEYYHGLEKRDDVRYMKIKLLKKYDEGQYPLEELREKALTSVQSRSKATPQLLNYLENE